MHTYQLFGHNRGKCLAREHVQAADDVAALAMLRALLRKDRLSPEGSELTSGTCYETRDSPVGTVYRYVGSRRSGDCVPRGGA